MIYEYSLAKLFACQSAIFLLGKQSNTFRVKRLVVSKLIECTRSSVQYDASN